MVDFFLMMLYNCNVGRIVMKNKEFTFFDDFKVVKRNGSKVDFNASKIALAIKKAFDTIKTYDDKVLDDDGSFVEVFKYSESDIQKVFKSVIKEIETDYVDKDKIKIEEIQDIIEKQLKKLKYEDVYTSFTDYRMRRNQSRELFTYDKKIHKFLKTLEGLGLKSSSEEDSKRENANVDGDTAMGTMLQYGSTVSKEFSKAYLMKKKYSQAHEDGDIHIHDMDFLAMGTTTCCQIDLDKLFKNGFSTGHGHLREPNDIMSYSALAAIAIQSNQNDQHGGQSIPAFDYYLAPGVLKTFKKLLKDIIKDYIDLEDLESFVNINAINKDIAKISTIDISVEYFTKYYKESEAVKKIFNLAIQKAYEKTEKRTYQAMEAFVHNLNTMHSRAGAQVPFSSINFGTDTSSEGRMITKNYMLAAEAGLGNGETPIFPISIFKVKEGVNFNPEDPNYDLFKLSCRVSAKRLFPNWSFLDSSFNKPFYKENDFRTEVGYMGCRTRVLANTVDEEKAITPGRGNLSFTSINLPRLGIKHGIVGFRHPEKPDLKSFFAELDELLELVKDQLLERYEIQCNRHVYNFPFLMGQGVWIDSERLKSTDKVKKVLKHGTLSIGFIGLAECLKALTGKHHAESPESQKLGLKIIKRIREKCDEYSQKYNLNFTCLATPAEGLSGRFVNIDKAIYGKIKGVTDRAYYTNSFHVPVYYNISIGEKLHLEGKYHSLTNAGHISYIELDGDPCDNLEGFENIVRIMKESDIGFGAINHPVDRDPVCGYVGIIKDVCPRCGRKTGEPVNVEILKRLEGKEN
ncbi:MAG: anaerobic ribonucleoside triphosphate reductase [Firmicutes bacterium]|nr:anaerobic ribonucleoside triphosphate reductase [Bacillota bacterium]